MSTGLHAVVLAAGKGTRMRSPVPKVLHLVLDRPLLRHAVETARAAGATSFSIVVGHAAEHLREAFPDLADHFVLQEPQLGTGHAVMAARARLEALAGQPTLVLNGDLPLLRTGSLRRLVETHASSGAAAALLSARLVPAGAYGRIVRDASGHVQRIVEARDATPEQLEIDEINAGVYLFDTPRLLAALAQLGCDNAQGEYYLTDVVARLCERGDRVEAVLAEDPVEAHGVNTLEELADAARRLQQRRNAGLMALGVGFEDPASTRVGLDAEVEPGAWLRSHTFVEGRSRVAAGASVGPFCRLVNASVGAEARVLDHCVLLDCVVGARASVGPFAHVRPESQIGARARVGNFVELKNARLGEGAKAPHLSYVGDASVGAGANIGAGTITCNYDGRLKHRTEIGQGSFVGSNSTLVAPVHIGAGAYVAAGSVITKDVPADALAVGRARQVAKAGWARARRQAREDDR